VVAQSLDPCLQFDSLLEDFLGRLVFWLQHEVSVLIFLQALDQVLKVLSGTNQDLWELRLSHLAIIQNLVSLVFIIYTFIGGFGLSFLDYLPCVVSCRIEAILS